MTDFERLQNAFQLFNDTSGIDNENLSTIISELRDIDVSFYPDISVPIINSLKLSDQEQLIVDSMVQIGHQILNAFRAL